MQIEDSITVEIRSDDKALPTYPCTETETSKDVYVLGTPDQSYSIFLGSARTFDVNEGVCFIAHIWIDGQFIGGRIFGQMFYAKDTVYDLRSRDGEGYYSTDLKFKELVIQDGDGDDDDDDEVYSQVGCIEVQISEYRLIGDTYAPSPNSPNVKFAPVDGAPGKVVAKTGADLGTAVGDINRVRAEFIYQHGEVGSTPLGIWTFFYRTKAALKSKGISVDEPVASKTIKTEDADSDRDLEAAQATEASGGSKKRKATDDSVVAKKRKATGDNVGAKKPKLSKL